MNQVCISNLVVSLTATNQQVDIKLVRHMVINSLRSHRSRFYDKYGELILCYDSKNYWRRREFPFYKGNRKKDREKSPLNWNTIFETLNIIRDEIHKNLPYKVIEVDGAEADDIIAALVAEQACVNLRLQNSMQPAQKILILSGDKDFQQLQKYPFVEQYNPVQKKFIYCENPKQYLNEHILKGDRSDGIPNFLSSNDTFVTNKRQRPLSKINIDKWCGKPPEEFCSQETLQNYERNQNLIDFNRIPKLILDAIIHTYETTETSPRGNMYPYFIKHGLTEMLHHITDF